MMEVSLYLDQNTFIRKISIPAIVPQIRVMGISPIDFGRVIEDGAEPSMSSVSVNTNIFVYKLYRYTEWGKGIENRYIFSHIEACSLPRNYEESSVDIGFEESTKEISLDKLKHKLRKPKKVRELLIKFFRKG